MKLRAGAGFILMVFMVLFSVCFGAYRGWSEERARVEETYAGLENMIHTRVESAYNLLTVAARHLDKNDEAFKRVTADRDVLEGKYSLSQKALANESLTKDAETLLGALASLPTVQQDSRDKMYVESYLPQMLAESEERAAGANYNTAAAEFNSRLEGSFSGWLASLMGIRAAEEFVAP